MLIVITILAGMFKIPSYYQDSYKNIKNYAKGYQNITNFIELAKIDGLFYESLNEYYPNAIYEEEVNNNTHIFTYYYDKQFELTSKGSHDYSLEIRVRISPNVYAHYIYHCLNLYLISNKNFSRKETLFETNSIHYKIKTS